ncbi:uncharacterized protein LOC119867505 isoform X3 [Canis lupus familiaris]|uniref:uncharacterized protein LOC119867505 isoform X3 n=1 Tax=Canis lupus familiaris TaxID=9615 RepID=UPI0015F17FDE|nr:uncharacterized protein LOC119867505 isoform X3 [Canis lupus familiaris]XP_038318683.1 uncharacterized protein LOC119867505 isoform X3 [Canis lupus familiaris]XP_038439595.1 uncharacterized protein LOC119867505 isoform X3 [Canis lupus familiaris]
MASNRSEEALDSWRRAEGEVKMKPHSLRAQDNRVKSGFASRMQWGVIEGGKQERDVINSVVEVALTAEDGRNGKEQGGRRVVRKPLLSPGRRERMRILSKLGHEGMMSELEGHSRPHTQLSLWPREGQVPN